MDSKQYIYRVTWSAEDNEKLPLPLLEMRKQYSGRFVVHVPSMVH